MFGIGGGETDEERKARLMKRDREYDENKRKEYLASRVGKEEGEESEPPTPSGRFKKLKEKLSSAADVNYKVEKKVSDVGSKVEEFKEGRRLKRFKLDEEKAVEKENAKKRAEIKVYGRELTEEEREKFEAAKAERIAKKAKRRANIKAGLSKFRDNFEEQADNGFGFPNLTLVGSAPKAAEAKPEGKKGKKGKEASPTVSTGLNDPLAGLLPKRDPNAPDPLAAMFALPKIDAGFGGGQAQQQGGFKKEPAIHEQLGDLSHLFQGSDPNLHAALGGKTKPKGKK